ncbi:MAG: Ku protein [Actinobacteria bacterium]|nr:Ku protein [Actinomycetota bacterium]
MASAIWSGAVAFGLVNVPVQMFSATHDQTVRFHQFERGTTSRIRNQRVNEDTGDVVEFHDIVKGYDLGDGDYVMVSPQELEAVEPGRSRTIEITDFVNAADIDSIYFDKAYYLAPREESAARAYELLVSAMTDTGRTAVATFVMRAKQYLAAIRPMGNVLTLETMFFHNEVRSPATVLDRLPSSGEVSQRDLDTAITLVEAMTTKWDPANYSDTFRDRVLELIEAKRAGEKIVARDDEPKSATVVDLMGKLQESVEAARRKRPGHAVRPDTGGVPATGAAADTAIRAAADRSADADDVEPGADDLEARSKSELYDLARDLDLPGRSSMTKDELVDAIRVAQATPRAS